MALKGAHLVVSLLEADLKSVLLVVVGTAMTSASVIHWFQKRGARSRSPMSTSPSSCIRIPSLGAARRSSCVRALEISLAPLTRFGVPFLRIQCAVPVSSTTEAEEPDLEGGLGGGRTLWPPMSLWAEAGGVAAGCVDFVGVSIFASSEWLEEESTVCSAGCLSIS